MIKTNQVTDFAPFRIPRSELDCEPVRTLVSVLKRTGRLPPEGGSPQRQHSLFPTKPTNL
ncbi:MAG: hypothetical protein HYY06_10230 [Deltaproteobacteria bacterium]|nr:hypothetical protein [Deltaproteobacteria bacterium]